MSRILIFGDSIAHGFNDPKGGWASMLREWVEGLDEWWTIYNLSIPGERATRILERFRKEAERRTRDEGRTIILFSVGVNDSRLNSGKPDVPEEEFRRALESLSRQGQEIGRVAFLGLTLVDEGKTCPIPWRQGVHYLNDRIRKYDSIISSVAKETGAGFIDILGRLPDNWKDLLDDGLHPAREGHEVIFHAVREFLGKWLD